MVRRAEEISSVDAVIRGFDELGYVLDPALATAVFLLVKMGRPLLVEGNAGVGKTDLAKTLAAYLSTELIRLQCYEGLDANSAIYEWNYQKQLLAIRVREQANLTVEEKMRHIFGTEFLLERPLLRSIRAEEGPPVLLIDEVDRSDEAFEAFLLELLSDFQITIPEFGTILARHRPYVVLTSNRTRDLSDALRRRCLYHWIDYPDFERELRIVAARAPAVGAELGAEVVRFVEAVRQLNLAKPPGVAETLDCAAALQSLGKDHLNADSAEAALATLAKSAEDRAKIKAEGIERLLSRSS